MAQHAFIDKFIAKSGRRPDYLRYERKKELRKAYKLSKQTKLLRHKKAMIFHEKQRKHKIQVKKIIKAHEEKRVKKAAPPDDSKKGAIPAYLMDRNEVRDAKVLSNTLKQKRKEKGGKWSVPIQKVSEVSEAEAFKVVSSGKRGKKTWKRMVNKICFVEPNFVRKPPKNERFIRPMAMRFNKANVTHPELKATFQLEILGVNKNPSSKLMTSLGVMTKGTIIEVNVSELGLVTEGGKIVWGKYAQITNKPELDGCINAVLLV